MQQELNVNEGLGRIIVDAAEANGFEPRFDYSGRGMYGKKCFGIVGSFSDIGGFFTNVAMSCQEEEIELSDFGDCVTSVSMDNMGTESIIYFPRLIISQEEPEDENDE